VYFLDDVSATLIHDDDALYWIVGNKTIRRVATPKP